MTKLYQVYRKLRPSERRKTGCNKGVYAGYFKSREEAEKFAKKVGGWVEMVDIITKENEEEKLKNEREEMGMER